MSEKYTGREWHRFCDAIREHERAMRKLAITRDELARNVVAQITFVQDVEKRADVLAEERHNGKRLHELARWEQSFLRADAKAAIRAERGIR